MRATWCREWEGYANRALREAGSYERIDYRSLKDRNIDRAPQPKLGIAGHVRNPISHLEARWRGYAITNHRNRVSAQTKALERGRRGQGLAVPPRPGASAAAARSIGIDPEPPRKRQLIGLWPGERIDP
jgi:hypothetical protein